WPPCTTSCSTPAAQTCLRSAQKRPGPCRAKQSSRQRIQARAQAVARPVRSAVVILQASVAQSRRRAPEKSAEKLQEYREAFGPEPDQWAELCVAGPARKRTATLQR